MDEAIEVVVTRFHGLLDHAPKLNIILYDSDKKMGLEVPEEKIASRTTT